jgi:putative hydrolase of the HAD superfamily
MMTFDAWQTLLFEKAEDDSRRMLGRSKRSSEVLERLGVRVSVEQSLSSLNAMVPWLEKVWGTDRDVTHLDQLEFIVREASKDSVALKDEWVNELSSAYVTPFFDIPPYLNPDAHEVLRWLKNRKKFTGIICNTGRTPGFAIRKLLAQEGVADYFDVMLFSDEVSVRKPDQRIFRIAAKTMKVKPAEIVHVGDNLRTDVWGAKNAGLKAAYLSTEKGRDKAAESDPNSLVSISRRMGCLNEKDTVPDWIITSLSEIIEAIES